MPKSFFSWLIKGSTLFSFFAALPVCAQITPDGTLPENSEVTRQGNTIDINQGTRAGDNLFHSFRDFSVPNGVEANFTNAPDVVNIINRVTGGNISNIEGLIRANGAANLFLINPAGIIFGDNATLDIGGSFLGSTADSIIFPDGEFSATDPENRSTLTINAPIGFNFRDNPEPITNRSNNSIGLRVPENETLALIGGNIFIEGGFVSTIGGSIELGSVGANSTVNITPTAEGFDFGYEGVTNFRNINLSAGAIVGNSGENPGDIRVVGRNISLVEGSQIVISAEAGQAGNIDIIASESLTLNGGDSGIFSNISGDDTGETSQITIEAPQLSLTDGAQIAAINNLGNARGTDIVITASDISLFSSSAIFAQASKMSSGDGGNITIDTERLTLKEGSLINTDTFGAGNGGNLLVNASESIDLNGSMDVSSDMITPSSLFANVGDEPTATGNGGNITINTSRLVARDGGQIGTTARNSGNGGILTINAESILFSGTSPLAEFRGRGRSGISVSTQPSFEDEESGEIIPTTGNGGTLNLSAEELIIEKGAFISANTFSLGGGGNANLDVNRLILREGGEIGAGSLFEVNPLDEARGNGGTLNISATESIQVTGIGEINGEPVTSSIFTDAESNGNAGNLTLNTNNLSVSDGGEVNASAEGQGAAGNITINSNSIDLINGKLIATTAAGEGGNITLQIADNLTLDTNSLISARATGDANGGNIKIDSNFIVAFPEGNNDILASAEDGQGGDITITAESVFGIAENSTLNNLTNDINASSNIDGLDGTVAITTPEIDAIRGATELPTTVIEAQQTAEEACASASGDDGKPSGLTVKGKGGILPQPKFPLSADVLNIGGKIVPETNNDNNFPNNREETKTSQIQPILTSKGAIYPARGIIKTKDGRVILTAYPTENTQRTPHHSPNCRSINTN